MHTVHIPTYTLKYLQPPPGFEPGSPASLPSPVTTTQYYLFLSQTFLLMLLGKDWSWWWNEQREELNTIEILTCALHSKHSNLWRKIPNFTKTYVPVGLIFKVFYEWKNIYYNRTGYNRAQWLKARSWYADGDRFIRIVMDWSLLASFQKW